MKTNAEYQADWRRRHKAEVEFLRAEVVRLTAVNQKLRDQLPRPRLRARTLRDANIEGDGLVVET